MEHIIEPNKLKDIEIKNGQCYFSIGYVTPIESKITADFEFKNGEHYIETFRTNYEFPMHYSFSLNRGAIKMFGEVPIKIRIINNSEHQVVVYACCW